MDKIKYSIKDLNNDILNIVCYVPNEETFGILKNYCPNMEDYYDNKCSYYLLPRNGRGDLDDYLKNTFGIEYIIIYVSNIEIFDNGLVYEFSNGVPFVWEDVI